jgi:hypothetical protein
MTIAQLGVIDPWMLSWTLLKWSVGWWLSIQKSCVIG